MSPELKANPEMNLPSLSDLSPAVLATAQQAESILDGDPHLLAALIASGDVAVYDVGGFQRFSVKDLLTYRMGETTAASADPVYAEQ